MNLYKKFTKDIGIIGITNLLTSLTGIILLPILTKTLGAYDYGVWIQVSVTIGLITMFTPMGLPYTMVRFLAGEKNRKEIQEGFFSTTIIVLITSSVASVLLIVLSEPVTSFLGGTKEITMILAFIIPVVCLNMVCAELFRAFQQMKIYSIFTVLHVYGNVALIAYLVLSGYGIFGAVLSLLIVSIIFLLIKFYLIVSKIRVKLPNFSRVREYFAFGLPTVPANISTWVVMSSDRYVIGYFLGVTFVGYYSPGYALGSIIMMFLAPIGFVLPAALSKLYDENRIEKVKTHLRYSLKYFLMLAIPSTFGLSLLSKPLLTILSTQEFASQGYLVTPFVALSILIWGVSVVIAQILALVKKTKIVGAVWSIAAIINLGLNIILVPYLGIIGAAITTLVAYFIASALIAFYSFKYFTFHVDWMFIVKSVFASIVMSLVIIKWNPVGVLNVLIVIGVCAVVYSGILLLLKGVKKEEIVFFKELLLLGRWH